MESSVEAFKDQLGRGYGLEFDLRISKDRKIVIIHDASLKRITGGRDERQIGDVDSSEILAMDFDGSHITTFDVLLDLIESVQSADSVSAIHLKPALQNKEDLDIVLSYLEGRDTSQFYIFDTTTETARYLKEKNPTLHLAPSVAHPYDIERYNQATGGTLLSSEEVFANKELFDGVWLDEWDLRDKEGSTKKFYTAETIKMFQGAGFWVGLVTPELHGTSPGLLGGEAHQDAKPFDTLALRFKEILNLKPDALCTDYPDHVRELLK
jgi:glycerophosphoryl diester phosphodiesterase